MGICCSKTHPEIIQVKETKEVATSTSSLKDKSVQDTQNDKESKGSEASLPSVDMKIVLDDEELFDTAAAQTRYSTFKHDREFDSVRRVSVYVNGRRIGQDEDHLKNTLTGQREKSEGGTTEIKDVLKRSLPEVTKALLNLEECLKAFDADDMEPKGASSADKVVQEKEMTHVEEEGRRLSVMCSNEKVDAEEETDLSSDEGESQEEGNLKIYECPAEKTSLNLEKIDEREEEVEATSLSKDESETESFFDVKGEMLSLFNRLEADASFIHSATGKEEDLISTKSEEQSSNGDSSMVREMETVFQELKQQYEPNTPAPAIDKPSEVDSFFDISKEMENIISKFEHIQINSEENTCIESNPGSPHSGSTTGELVSRLQNLVLHSDDSGSDKRKEFQGGQDEISKEGSYFNMQEDLDFRLDLIRQGNVI